MERIVDRDAILELVGGDSDLLKEVVALFLTDCPRLFDDIRGSISDQNSEVLQRSAHSVKGALQILAAESAIEKAIVLELIGKNSEFSKAEAAFKELEREVERLLPELNQLAIG